MKHPRGGRAAMAQQKQALLLEAARALFLERGMARVTMDDVAQAAGVSKRTLYKYFGARDSFIAAAIDYDGRRWGEWFYDAVGERASSPAERLAVFFDVLKLWVAAPEFRGCLFAQAPQVFRPLPTCIAAVVDRHYEEVLRFFRESAAQAGIRAADRTARQLLLPTASLLSGVPPLADEEPAALCGEIAEACIARALTTPSRRGATAASTTARARSR